MIARGSGARYAFLYLLGQFLPLGVEKKAQIGPGVSFKQLLPAFPSELAAAVYVPTHVTEQSRLPSLEGGSRNT